ncbi:uncharacterized protein AB675_6138 [Cyphellophora attinorum]|uniref:MYND-type domain-containing protein n=1 Tax=Cyphellophora attinorum TaxID=1664694 RepID=A0A0N0NQA5_9EURO|nr:uncharacterized protein AB675_6138 [Phialophora attinorum]KPI43681.1 hypothetical protein AB675_6138 [Phialophora attinorum]
MTSSMTGSNALDATCIMCPRMGHLLCKGCGDARYCSGECQTLDWSKVHKTLCATFAANSDRNRPSKDHRRALFFSGGSSPPRFQWVRVYSCVDSRGPNEDFFSLMEFGTNEKDSCSQDYNEVQGRSQARVKGEALHWFKKMNPKAEDTYNVGLRNFTRSGAYWQDFRGPIFVLRAATNDQRQVRHLDMTMRDARGAADWLGQTYRDGYDQKHLRNVTVLGTIVAATGSVQTGAKKWQDVVLNGCDGIWNNSGSGIANLLGIPILGRVDALCFSDEANAKMRNDTAALLFRDVVSDCVLPQAQSPPPFAVYKRPDIDREGIVVDGPTIRQLTVGATGFGSSLLKYSTNTTGDAYLVRADGKPFPSQHAEALCGFIKDKVEPKLQAAISDAKEGMAVAERESILKYICRANFEEYYGELREAKIKDGDVSWSAIPNPYEIKSSDMRARVGEVWAEQKAKGFEQSSEKMARQERGMFTQADFKEAFKSLGGTL